MVLSLPPGEPAVTRLSYFHMMRLDSLIWTQYLQDHPGRFTRAWYDVHVGTPIETPPGAPPELERIAEGTGCKRIDVVAQTLTELWIIEVKPYAHYVAYGQVLSYVDLFRRRYGEPLPLVPVIVCTQVDPDIVLPCRDAGIRIERTSKIPW